MTTNPIAWESSERRDDLILTVVRHNSIEEMQADMENEYTDGAKKIHGMDDLGGAGALTGGSVVDGESQITVYIPYGHKDEDYAEIVSHEAVHVAFAIHRHKLNGKLDDFTPLRVSMGGQADAVNEESIAYMVGQTTRFIWAMMAKIDEHKRCMTT